MVSVWLYVPNVIGYIRAVLWIASMWYIQDSPGMFALLYTTSFGLDAIDGHAARILHQESSVGALLDMTLDRASSATLFAGLATVLRGSWAPIFYALAGLDLVSHWAQMTATLSLQDYDNPQSHKEKAAAYNNPLMKAYYTNRKVLFGLCFGNEAFFGAFYWTCFPEWLSTSAPWIIQVTTTPLMWILFPTMILKQVINVFQLHYALHAIVNDDTVKHSKRQSKEK